MRPDQGSSCLSFILTSVASSCAENLTFLPQGCCNGLGDLTWESALERLSNLVIVLTKRERPAGTGTVNGSREEPSMVNSKVQSVFDPTTLYLTNPSKGKVRSSAPVLISSSRLRVSRRNLHRPGGRGTSWRIGSEANGRAYCPSRCHQERYVLGFDSSL